MTTPDQKTTPTDLRGWWNAATNLFLPVENEHDMNQLHAVLTSTSDTSDIPDLRHVPYIDSALSSQLQNLVDDDLNDRKTRLVMESALQLWDSRKDKTTEDMDVCDFVSIMTQPNAKWKMDEWDVDALAKIVPRGYFEFTRAQFVATLLWLEAVPCDPRCSGGLLFDDKITVIEPTLRDNRVIYQIKFDHFNAGCLMVDAYQGLMSKTVATAYLKEQRVPLVARLSKGALVLTSLDGDTTRDFRPSPSDVRSSSAMNMYQNQRAHCREMNTHYDWKRENYERSRRFYPAPMSQEQWDIEQKYKTIIKDDSWWKSYYERTNDYTIGPYARVVDDINQNLSMYQQTIAVYDRDHPKAPEDQKSTTG